MKPFMNNTRDQKNEKTVSQQLTQEGFIQCQLRNHKVEICVGLEQLLNVRMRGYVLCHAQHLVELLIRRYVNGIDVL